MPSADVTARARLLGLPVAALGETRRRATADHDAGRRGGTARPKRAVGRRPVLDVGRPPVRSAAGTGRRHRRQGRIPREARRHPRRAAGVLRLDEQRKALVRSRFRRTSGPTDGCSRPPTSSSSRRGPRHWHTGVSARPTSRGATAGCGCGSPATAPTASEPTGWRSATTPRYPAAWSAAPTASRCSAATRSPTR